MTVVPPTYQLDEEHSDKAEDVEEDMDAGEEEVPDIQDLLALIDREGGNALDSECETEGEDGDPSDPHRCLDEVTGNSPGDPAANEQAHAASDSD